MKDPYDLLGVRRGDNDETIRKAYHKLAKRHHPDLNPGKPEAAERFKEVNAANDLLSDPERRARFDRGEIDAEGNEAAPRRPGRRSGPAGADAGGAHPFHWSYGDPGAGAGGGAGRSRGAGGAAGGVDFEDLDSLFADAFGANARRGGGDVQYALTVDFLDAANGAVKRLSLPDGRTLDVTIPAGLRDGHVLRLRGQGRPARDGVPAGDALVEVTVAAHPLFHREGDDIIVRLPVTLQELVLGASVEVPTIRGQVRLAIPPNSANGARLRLKGRGVGGGHQFVELALVLPSQPEPGLAEFLRGWAPSHPFNPRENLVP